MRRNEVQKRVVRVVKSKEGEISLDLTGKKAGRGAYICSNLECLQKARKARRLEKAFSARIPDEIYDEMEQQLKNSLVADAGKAEK